jgi:SPX domain protein involved in polyphosphate accumulation
MVKFGKVLISQRIAEWEEHYINYKMLKQELKRHPYVGSDHFAALLDHEIEKVVFFYLKKQGELSSALWKLRCVQSSASRRFVPANCQSSAVAIPSPRSALRIPSYAQDLQNLGVTVVNLLHFLELNTTGLRKILKKHDKKMKKRKRATIMGKYLSRRQDPYSPLDQVRQSVYFRSCGCAFAQFPCCNSWRNTKGCVQSLAR